MDTIRYDGADFLDNEADCTAYLNAVLEENDPTFFLQALGNVAKAQGMSKIAKNTGLARQQLYKTLSTEGNPTVITLFKLCTEMGIKLTVANN